jgi:hypothetical protein
MLILASIPVGLMAWIFWATLTNVGPERQSRA